MKVWPRFILVGLAGVALALSAAGAARARPTVAYEPFLPAATATGAEDVGRAIQPSPNPLPKGEGFSKEPVYLTLVHDTHFHGAFEGSDRVTLAHYAGLVQGIRARSPNTIFAGVGDDIATSLYSAQFRGEHMIAALNAAGLDIDTFGNHEFDYGPDNLRRRIRESRFPWVTANVLDRATGEAFAYDLGVRRYIVWDVGGVRVGLTGFAPADTPALSSPGPSVRVLDPVQAARQVVPQMQRAGAQVIVVLSHLAWPDTEALVAAVPGIHVAVGDHASTRLERPKLVNGTIVSRRGDGLGRVGQLDLAVVAGQIVGWSYTEHRLAATDPADQGTAEVIGRYAAALDAALGEVVGATSTPLDATREASRSRETALGNLIADALRARAQADVAVQNGGGIRSERVYEPGSLTRKDIAAILPFANYAAKLRVSGQAIRAMLELSVGSVEERHGRFLQVSGLRFTYDPAAPAGSRVQEIWVGGRPLDENARYTLAVNDFMQGGGDGYAMLASAEVLLSGQGGELLANVVMDYLAAQGTVAPVEEGRITALGG